MSEKAFDTMTALSEDVSALEAPLSLARATSPGKCPQCHHVTSNRGLCTECMSDKYKDDETRFADSAGEAKLILSHNERMRRARDSSARTAQATAGSWKRDESEKQRLALAGYVPLEQRVVQAREAITELVRAGGTRTHILRAVNEGVQAASQPEEAVFTGTQGPLGGGHVLGQ